MSMHVQIGDCTTPEAIPMLITFYYYYISLLYWPRQKKITGNGSGTVEKCCMSSWTASAQKAARDAQKVHPHLAMGVDGISQSCDAAEGTRCRLRGENGREVFGAIACSREMIFLPRASDELRCLVHF